MRLWMLLCFAGALCVSGLAAAQETGEPLRIAVVGDLSGGSTLAHAPFFEGARKAAEHANAAGGVFGLPVELMELDSQGTALGAHAATQSAVQKAAHVILGPMFSSHCLAAARVAAQTQTPFISALSTHPDITKTGDCVFRVCFNDNQQARALARVAKDVIGADKVAILVDAGSDYSMNLAEKFFQSFQLVGGKVTLQQEYVAHFLELQDVLQRLKDSRADVLFIPGHTGVQDIIAQVMAMEGNVVLLGGDGWGSVDLRQAEGQVPVLAYYTAHWTPEMGDEQVRRMVAHLPLGSTQAFVLAYDALALAVDAAGRAGAADQAALCAALTATSDYPGVSGSITFNGQGDVRKPIAVVRIERGVKRLHMLLQPAGEQ